MDARSEKHQNM